MHYAHTTTVCALLPDIGLDGTIGCTTHIITLTGITMRENVGARTKTALSAMFTQVPRN